MASVRLENLCKNFGAVRAVDGVSLEIPDGELMVLVGPSGCGKSTLLRLIAGLEDVSDGRIVIDGTPEELRADRDVQEFYLGLGSSGEASYREAKRYRRKRRWLS